MSAKTAHEISTIFKSKQGRADARQVITLEVTNASGHIVAAGGEWAVKDESVNPQVVVSAKYPQLGIGASSSQDVQLPHGISWGAFHFVSEDGQGEWTDVHGAIANHHVHLTLK